MIPRPTPTMIPNNNHKKKHESDEKISRKVKAFDDDTLRHMFVKTAELSLDNAGYHSTPLTPQNSGTSNSVEDTTAVVNYPSQAGISDSTDKKASRSALTANRVSTGISPTPANIVLESSVKPRTTISASSDIHSSPSISQSTPVTAASTTLVTPISTPSSTAPSGIVPAVVEEYELAKFGLTAVDKVVESFSCALYSGKGLGLTHGRLYVTKHFLAYQGWPETRVLLSLAHITAFEKMNTLYYIPNAIMIRTKSEEYFFGSFIERDSCHVLLCNMAKIASSLAQYETVEDLNQYKQLVYGLQKDSVSDLMVNLTAVAVAATAGVTSATTAPSNSAAPVVPSPAGLLTAPNSSISAEDSLVLPPVEDTLDFYKLFQQNKVDVLLYETLPISATQMWKDYWKQASGYRGFLEVEGDLDIVTDEWAPMPQNTAASNSGAAHPALTVMNEDLCRLPFTHYRSFKYSHPRTTMLFIGPKNAPATQTHYLYIPAHSNAGNDKENRDYATDNKSDTTLNIDTIDSVPDLLVLTVTQFDGIPLADCFKVLQYWSYQHTDSPNSLKLTVGLHIHYVKHTIMKSQVSSGVKDELGALTKRWVQYITRANSNVELPSHLSIISPQSETMVDNGTSRKLSRPGKLQDASQSNNVTFYQIIIVLLLACLLFQFYRQVAEVRELALIHKRLCALEDLLKKSAPLKKN